MSQRIERFIIEARIGDTYSILYEGTTVGYKKIIPIPAMITSEIRIYITDSRVAPTLSFIGVY